MNTSFIRKAASLVRGLFALGLFAAGASVATANGPVFNGLPNDHPTIQVAKPGAQWSIQTSASVGDVVNIFGWIHNNADDNTNPAYNVRYKATGSTPEGSNHTLTGRITADNAATVTGTATVNVGQASRLRYIPGTAKLYKNINGTLTQVSWPAGVNPDDLVSANGANLQTILGCWANAQAIVAQYQVEGVTPQPHTNKQVQLSGGAAYSESVSARPADELAFKVFLENRGTGTGLNPKVVDTLDSRLTYVPGSSKMRVKINNVDQDINIPDSQIQFNGQTITWNLGSEMAARPDAAIYLQFKAKLADASAFQIGTTTLQNCAQAGFTQGMATSNCVQISVQRDADPVVSFTIRKEVTNLTLDNGRWYDNQYNNARPKDRLAYRLTIINTGNTAAENVSLKDILPSGVTYAGNGTRNGATANLNGITAAGINIGTVQPGTANAQRFTFEATVADSCATPSPAVNTAQVIWNSQVRATDTAGTNISCSQSLIITKQVSANGAQFANQVTSREGDVVTFRIYVQNNGNTTLVQPVVRDPMPQYLSYVSGSLAIDGEFMSQTVANGFFGTTGMMLTNLAPGEGKVITFQARVADCPPFGQTIITNTAYAWAQGVAQQSAMAKVVVEVRKPTF